MGGKMKWLAGLAVFATLVGACGGGDDGNGGNTTILLSKDGGDGQSGTVAAPRPRVPVLNVFGDTFLLPVLEGGLIALFLSLILAYMISRWVADPLQKVINAEPPSLGDDIPISLRLLVDKALDKDPAERYESAGAFAQALSGPA